MALRKSHAWKVFFKGCTDFVFYSAEGFAVLIAS